MSNREAATLAATIVVYAFGVTALAVYMHWVFGAVGFGVFLFLAAAFRHENGGGR